MSKIRLVALQVFEADSKNCEENHPRTHVALKIVVAHRSVQHHLKEKSRQIQTYLGIMLTIMLRLSLATPRKIERKKKQRNIGFVEVYSRDSDLLGG